jgi:hypothetical protein
VANQNFYLWANASEFTNRDVDNDVTTPNGGQLRYDCGIPESLLAVAADGETLCGTTGTLRCNLYGAVGWTRRLPLRKSGNNLEAQGRPGRAAFDPDQRQYRICLEWTQDGPFAVEIVDYH